VLPNLQSF